MKPAGIDIKQEEIRTALEEIAAQSSGLLNPRAVVEAARDEASPLHDQFEWDDGAAAEAYRLAQAGALIRRIKITIIRPQAESRQVSLAVTRAYQSRPSQRTKEGGYEPVQRIVSEQQKRDEMLAQVLKELAAYRKRYAELFELREVWSAIDEAADLFAEQSQAAPSEERATA